MITAKIPAGATTGIGSLPHHNIDAALEYSFRHSIPYLPQIPIRNPWEYMIPQALEGIPGLRVDSTGVAALDLDVWLGRHQQLDERLKNAFDHAKEPEAFAPFEPSNATSSSWQPFLWELTERESKLAKVQIAGPLTAQWSLRLKDGSDPNRYPEIGDQIYRLVLARSIAMVRRLQNSGVQAVIYLDEPGLYGLTKQSPRHVLGLSQLKLMIQTLKKEGAIVGVHCCSNTEWNALLETQPDILSIDAGLSLQGLLKTADADLKRFLNGGGRISLGVIPTTSKNELNGRQRLALIEELEGSQPVLAQAILTPACGLALHSPADAEQIWASLSEFASEISGQ